MPHDWCKANGPSLLIIVSAVLGLCFGFILKSIFTISPVVLTYIALPGTLIIRAFMMIIVPLILASLATSITGTKRGENKRLIIWTFVLIVVFSSCCSTFGAIMVSIIKPGVRNMSMIVANKDSPSDGQQSHEFDIKQMISSQDESIYDVFIKSN
ncbi:unnamed protein product [Medioppia subpectinata]|uniref:Amino acid transporter n=1 Tax=Medioppia subpectinata TaxID=1979941 RepID=A0A7R9PW98_9ACAR|nr:unnamed protein product [Medioppia subpectinata]CAG2103090.1 unnamed protein product [Medioppia subpectinata]